MTRHSSPWLIATEGSYGVIVTFNEKICSFHLHHVGHLFALFSLSFVPLHQVSSGTRSCHCRSTGNAPKDILAKNPKTLYFSRCFTKLQHELLVPTLQSIRLLKIFHIEHRSGGNDTIITYWLQTITFVLLCVQICFFYFDINQKVTCFWNY